jgi:hypothetical protein
VGPIKKVCGIRIGRGPKRTFQFFCVALQDTTTLLHNNTIFVLSGELLECRVHIPQSQSHRTNRNKTFMNDELDEVKAKIATTEIDLTTAKAEGKDDLVLSLTHLLVGLIQKELLLSAGEMHYNRGVCNIVCFLSI